MYKRISGVGKHLDFYILDLIFLIISYILGYLIRFGFHIVGYLENAPVSFGIILCLVYLLTAVFTKAYKNILYRDKWIELARVILQVAMTLVIFLLYLYITKQSEILPRLMFGYVAIISVIFIFTYRCIYKNIVRKQYNNNPKRPHMLYVAEKRHIKGCLDSMRKQKFNDFYLAGVVIKGIDEGTSEYEGEKVVCEYKDIKKYILTEVVDAVMIAIDDERERMDLAKYLLEAGIVVYISLEDSTAFLPHLMTGKIAGKTVLISSNNVASQLQLGVKRAIDIIGGLVGLIITGILYVIVAPQIKKKDPGPAFFKQQRVGKNGRIFYIYKFRSMYMDAEARKKDLMGQNQMQGLMFKMEDDPRILPGIGNKIRDWSIDEFPQFWNVFKGDMSLVGTRPPTLDEYSKYNAHHKSRLAFKPGITGLWQVSGRSEITDFEEIVRLDNEYIRGWNLRLDIKIIFKTIGVVLGRKGSM